ncbi:10033_t:CDS:2 [Ambispora leptoticha]|uniref:10033_t:CDS:1 n=1 Tax=Ambispora leptoticha TaxID=144679 RepID=A0A9N8WG71_9GLOM|nr:10033_t:CDS:2 [Ambispora leptoticha]
MTTLSQKLPNEILILILEKCANDFGLIDVWRWRRVSRYVKSICENLVLKIIRHDFKWWIIITPTLNPIESLDELKVVDLPKYDISLSSFITNNDIIHTKFIFQPSNGEFKISPTETTFTLDLCNRRFNGCTYRYGIVIYDNNVDDGDVNTKYLILENDGTRCILEKMEIEARWNVFVRLDHKCLKSDNFH